MTPRRIFIKNSLMGTVGFALSGIKTNARSYRSIMGANDRLNVAVIGIRGQGLAHINNWCKIKDTSNVRLKTLCDTDEYYFSERAKTVFEQTEIKPLVEWDMRKVFDDKEIDAVSLAIPNHWHALATIWACQAGKHVYVEKPACHNLYEGRKMIEASEKYKSRVQVGFQNRSIPNVQEAIAFLHSGGIGKVFMARGLCIKPRNSFGIAVNSSPPASLHYDQWLGPAEYTPYNEKKVHYNWHWFWSTGNGDTGNQGPHQFDIARWGLNMNEHPTTIFSSGGLYGIDPGECAQETPNTQTSILKYADGKIIEFETRGTHSNAESSLQTSIGNIFYGTEGYLELNGESWRAFRGREKVPFTGSKDTAINPNESINPVSSNGALHFINFIDAIRESGNSKLNCDIKEGYYSTALPLLSNISYRLGRSLHFQGKNERFTNDPDANKLTTRHYRAPFVLPQHV